MFGQDIGIDLGTSSVRVYVKGKGRGHRRTVGRGCGKIERKAAGRRRGSSEHAGSDSGEYKPRSNLYAKA